MSFVRFIRVPGPVKRQVKSCARELPLRPPSKQYTLRVLISRVRRYLTYRTRSLQFPRHTTPLQLHVLLLLRPFGPHRHRCLFMPLLRLRGLLS